MAKKEWMGESTQSRPFGSYGVDFIDENDRWGVLFGDTEQLADQLGAIPTVLLDQLGTNDAQESGRRLVRDSFG